MVESRFYHRHVTLDDLTFNAPDMGHTLKKCAPVDSRKKPARLTRFLAQVVSYASFCNE